MEVDSIDSVVAELMGVDSVVAELESAGENLILIRSKTLGMSNDVLLLRRTGVVSYLAGVLSNLRGIKFGRDTALSTYSLQFVGVGGIYFPEARAIASGEEGFSVDIQIGEQSCISYLKRTGDWDADGGLRIGCDRRWEKALGSIDLIINNEVRPFYLSAP